VAVGGAAGLFVIGGVVEAWLIGVLQPSAGELTWISDIVDGWDDDRTVLSMQ
jgi:hypothetical protein